MPAKPGACQYCGIAHAPDQAHCCTSPYYQMRFTMLHKRAATWADAIAHCPEYIAAFWKTQLLYHNAWTEPLEGIEVIAERYSEIPRVIRLKKITVEPDAEKDNPSK